MEQIAVYPELKRLKAENEELKRKNEDLEERIAIVSPDVVHCKDCKHLIDNPMFMNDGYCGKMMDDHCVKFKPDDDWFCAYGEQKEGD